MIVAIFLMYGTVACFLYVLHNTNPSIVGSFSKPSSPQYGTLAISVICGKKRTSQNLKIQVREYRRLATTKFFMSQRSDPHKLGYTVLNVDKVVVGKRDRNAAHHQVMQLFF